MANPITTTAHAGPKLPEVFHGQWCETNTTDEYRPCNGDEVGDNVVEVRLDAKGFQTNSHFCTLQSFGPNVSEAGLRLHRAKFECFERKGRRSTATYWIGFYAPHEMFMRKEGASQ